MLQKKLNMKNSWKKPSAQAPHEITSFQTSTSWFMLYPAPPSYIRRFIPERPWMNIGIKTTLMLMNEPQKWIRPSRSFILRPVAFGNQ